MQNSVNDKQSALLNDVFNKEMIKKDHWVAKKSAIMIFHGVGNQRPFDTLDTFARGMLETFADAGFDAEAFTLTHQFAKRDDGRGGSWFDNVIRVTYKNSENYLDFYEFYWAPETENKVSLLDTQNWIQNLANGAKKFYQDQKRLGETYHDESFFFAENGDFREERYRRFIKVATMFIPLMMFFIEKIGALIMYIPFIGALAYNLVKSLQKSSLHALSNIVGDVVAYNSPDPKNRLFEVRRSIQQKAYAAIKYLVEPMEGTDKEETVYQYDKVIIASHSLGTQVAFDALNILNQKISLNEVKGVDQDGYINDADVPRRKISDLLSGFITFGSHLDKAAFFFREQTEKNAYLKEQIRSDFYCFKQKQWNFDDNRKFTLHSSLKHYLDDITWRNYYDANDPVSGHLDYYHNVTNLNCDFTGKSGHHYDNIAKSCIDRLYPFTHSYYWSDKRMYGDIIVHYLS